MDGYGDIKMAMINLRKDDSEDSQFASDLSCCVGVVMSTESQSRRSGLREWEAAPAWAGQWTLKWAPSVTRRQREDTEWARVSALSISTVCARPVVNMCLWGVRGCRIDRRGWKLLKMWLVWWLYIYLWLNHARSAFIGHCYLMYTSYASCKTK